MDALLKAALIGTANQPGTDLTTDTPLDQLLAVLPEDEFERKLLLAAGAQALYSKAGKRPVQITAMPEPAPEETARFCSPEATLLLSRFLSGEKSELLVEVLTRVRERNLVLPHTLLPQALSINTNEQRAAIAPVLGERGRWLSQFNTDWKWVRNYLHTNQTDLPEDAETIWEEGSSGQRAEILRRLRAVDPSKARTWLESVWKQEKADVRHEMVLTLKTGLSLDDEPFLESIRDDRAASVRADVVQLLSLLPESAFCRHMRDLASTLLSVQDSAILIKPPATFNATWVRNGLSEEPPRKSLGKRAWWLIQILSLVPPTFWETHLGGTPEQLIERVKGEKWGENVIDAWSRATRTYRTPGWIFPLWDWWQHLPEDYEQPMVDYTIHQDLFALLSGEEAESVLLRFFITASPDPWSSGRKAHNGYVNQDWISLLWHLPQPWSESFARAYLQALRAHYAGKALQDANYNPYNDPAFSGLDTVARALPQACFAEAQQPFELSLPDKENWRTNYTRTSLKNFTDIVYMRQKIYEEII